MRILSRFGLAAALFVGYAPTALATADVVVMMPFLAGNYTAQVTGSDGGTTSTFSYFDTVAMGAMSLTAL